MGDIYKEICTLWEKGDFLQALETVWKLDKVRFNYRELTTRIPLRELVFRGCKQAVETAKSGNSEAAGQRLEALLTFKPDALIIQEDDPKDRVWCRKFRLQMIRAHLLGAKMVVWAGECSSQKPGARQAATRELVKAAWRALYILDETAAPATEPDTLLLDQLADELTHPRRLSHEANADSRIHQAISSLLESEKREPQIPPAFLRHLSRELLNREKSEGQARKIPFALVRKQENEAHPFLARFVCERVPYGKGELFIDPEQAFVPMDEDFRSLFFNVPRALKLHLESSASLLDSDVRLRIELFDRSAKMMPLQGNSASGAALRGAYFTLTGKHLNNGIIVLARLDANGNFRGVGSLRQKLRAVVESRQFNSLLISQENLMETEEAFAALGEGFVSQRLGEELDVSALGQDDYVVEWIPLAE
jgi:hypothetical protein